MIKEFEGRTEKEAIDVAIEELGLDREEFDVEIVESEKKRISFSKGKCTNTNTCVRRRRRRNRRCLVIR